MQWRLAWPLAGVIAAAGCGNGARVAAGDGAPADQGIPDRQAGEPLGLDSRNDMPADGAGQTGEEGVVDTPPDSPSDGPGEAGGDGRVD